MSEQPGHVRVALSFSDIRKGRVVEGAPGDQRVRVQVPGIADRILVEKHPHRPGLYRPVEETKAIAPPPSIEIPEWLEAILGIILTVVGLLVVVTQLIVAALRRSYESIPQKTSDRLVIVYGSAALGALLVVRWYFGARHMDAAEPGHAYALALQAVAGWGMLYAGVWRACSASYPFDPTERPADRRPTAKALAGLICLGIVVLLVVAGPTAVRAPMTANGYDKPRTTGGMHPAPILAPASSPPLESGSQGTPTGGQGLPPARSSPPAAPGTRPEIQPVRVPAVAGLPRASAETRLRAAGLSPTTSAIQPWSDTTPAGHVIRTIPSSGDGMVRPGATVQLVLSNGPQPKCPHCQAKFNSQSDLDSHLAQQVYACSRYPNCTFTAASREDVIRHYESQPQQDIAERLANPNCRSDAFVIGGKWRIKVVPAPACANLKKPETWKLERVRD